MHNTLEALAPSDIPSNSALTSENTNLTLRVRQLSETLDWKNAEIEALKLSNEIARKSCEAYQVEVERLLNALRQQKESTHVHRPMTAEEIKAFNPSKMNAMKSMFERGVRAAEKFHGVVKK